ncbi:HAE1 family hydrophobic/amphiphilic exporter-1 [Clostridium algifaecis]|uniref:HAE1 family hydrophobic/amphiphilic exporter-1 n=1 Tax=Clostridium algifaecis TaxID=1472040 RepID=A0ABS4KVX9_9CLOT|nr:efflux RND transporter permease subunit [Clostridium algifaecis]MBP2034186.1 HAE1 family hydrophobic/amphiphilic exporter-1 [Clostridium algifaecis]
MNLTKLSVKKPAAITMVILFLLGLGIYGYKNLGANLMPSMDIPMISISTSYAGASASDIRTDIVKPIEDAVSGISGIDKINSTAREGVGQTMIQFKMSTDMNTAFLDVQKAVDNAQAKLPKNADKPVLFKIDMNASSILILSVSRNASHDELYNESNNIKEALQKVPGIGNVSLEGIQKKQLMIKLDKNAIESYGVNINTLVTKLQSDNINIPAGQIKQENLNQPVRVMSQFNDINEVKNILVPTSSGNGTVHLSDIADVNLDYPDKSQYLRLDGKDTIAISIQKQSDANVVEAVNNVYKQLDQIKKNIPSGIHVTVAYDTTTFIKSSLTQIKHSLVEGIITTALVLLVFLRSWKSSLIVLIAIPTSLISTFFMMHVLHFTLNMLSLMGLSLCIGILVDDSIVVLENIQRHLAMKKDPINAAIDGRMEIGLAAVAITLCDVVVYLPVAFMSGMAGKFFKEFGITIAVASLFSLFVSFTITPMLASRLYKKIDDNKSAAKTSGIWYRIKQTRAFKILNSISTSIDRVTISYKKALIWSLDHRKRVLAISVACLIAVIALLPIGAIGTELIPTTDQSMFSINMTFDSGATLDQMDKKVRQVESHLHTINGIDKYYSFVGSNGNDLSSDGSNSSGIYVMLKPKSERKLSQSEIAKEVRTWGKAHLTGTDFSVQESNVGSGNSNPISISILGSSPDTLNEISDKVESIIKSVPGVIDVNNSTKSSKSELRVNIDRLAAAQYGISSSDISSVLRTAIQGSTAGVYRTDGDDYDITVKFEDGTIKTPDDIGSIKILNQSGEAVPLSQISTIVKADSQQSMSRQDRQDVATISANIQGRSLGSVDSDITKKLKKLSVPEGYQIKFGGDQQSMSDNFTSLIEALGISLILIYMILVVLYESFLTPFIRMISLPCALIGAFAILAITGKTLNMMSLIGLIMLDGLASKNGTLLIDYTNTLMKRGENLREALIDSGTTRLRPIIMTSATMIVGMLPSALSLGEGSEMKSSMATVVIGGMIASTILTPIILPIVYTLMDDLKNHLFKKRKKQPEIQEV